jgi:hypothetical protein
MLEEDFNKKEMAAVLCLVVSWLALGGFLGYLGLKYGGDIGSFLVVAAYVMFFGSIVYLLLKE